MNRKQKTPKTYALQYIGTNHLLSQEQVVADVGFYTVIITNETQNVFDEVVIFYAAAGIPGVVFLQHTGFVPGDVITFRLGACPDMVSYWIAFFIGEDMVAKWPEEGNMTPQVADQLNPYENDPCVDSWTIV